MSVTATNYFVTSGVKNNTANLLINIAVNYLTNLKRIQTLIDSSDNSTGQYNSTTTAVANAHDSLETLIDDLTVLIRNKKKSDVESQVATVIADLSDVTTKLNLLVADIQTKFHPHLDSTDGNHVVNYTITDLNALFKLTVSLTTGVAIPEDSLINTFYISIRQFSGSDSLLQPFYNHVHDFFINIQAQLAISTIIATNVEEIEERWIDYVSNNGVHDHSVLSTYITTIHNGLNTLQSVITDVSDSIGHGLDQVTTGTETADVTTVI